MRFSELQAIVEALEYDGATVSGLVDLWVTPQAEERICNPEGEIFVSLEIDDVTPLKQHRTRQGNYSLPLVLAREKAE